MKRFINIAPEGYKIISPILIVWIFTYIISIYSNNYWVGILNLCLFSILLIVCYFFRDPIRRIKGNEQDFLSPADGRIVSIKDYDDSDIGPSKKIAIFLSYFDVHRQWVPLNSKVLKMLYNPGKFFGAYKNKSSLKNEQNSILFSDNNENIFKIKQIAGFVARRIVNHMKPNLGTYQGQKLGFIRFGSRVEIIIPNNFDIKVKKGMKVRGCKTVIGKFK